jgi:hypothetical protein
MSDANQITVYKIFFAWEDEREERWLEDMARQGWHLLRGNIAFFTFVKGEPAEVCYRLDYRGASGADPEYFALFRDAGWEQVETKCFGWYCFRSPAAKHAPDIYTDVSSRVQKYQRLVWVLAVVLGANLFAFVMMASNEHLRWMSLMNVAAVAILIYALWRVRELILRLKRRTAES